MKERANVTKTAGEHATEANQTLNQLYATLKFSLAGYLRYAKPWVAPTDECLREAIRRIADEQTESSNRVGSLIIERRGNVDGGSFSMRFTAFNDLSLAYLAPRVVEDQERIVREVKLRALQLSSDPPAHALALELLDAARANRDNLRELIDDRKYDVSHRAAIAHASDNDRQNSTPAVATAAA